MNKLKELIEQLCSNGVEYKKISDIATDIYRGSGIKRDQVTDFGIPCVRYGEIYTTYNIWFNECVSHTDLSMISNPKYFEHGDILFAITGESVEDIAKSCAYMGDERCLAGGDIVVVKHNQNPKYLAYALESSDARIQKSRGKVKSKVVHSSVPAISDITLPVPPIEIQNEIVKILDDLTQRKVELTERLTAELNAREEQFNYYQSRVFSFDDNVVYRELQEIADIGTGSHNTNEELEDGKYPFFVRSQEIRTLDSYDFDETAIITSGDGVGVGKIFHFVEGKYALHQRAYRIHIRVDDVLPKYYYYFMKSTFYEYIDKESFHSSVTSVRRPMLNKFSVPIPSVTRQKDIIDKIDKLEEIYQGISSALLTEIDSRNKQYEYYRDKLLSFNIMEA